VDCDFNGGYGCSSGALGAEVLSHLNFVFKGSFFLHAFKAKSALKDFKKCS